MKLITFLSFIFLSGVVAVGVAQEESLPADLKAAALRDAACTQAADTPEKVPTLEASPIRAAAARLDDC